MKSFFKVEAWIMMLIPITILLIGLVAVIAVGLRHPS